MRKKINIIISILVLLLMIITAVMAVYSVLSKRFFDHRESDLFGYRFFTVQSGSALEETFTAGDLAIFRKTDPASLSPGDLIAFISTNSSTYGKTIAHKIRRAATSEETGPGFITCSTFTGPDDEVIVTYPYILGKHTATVRYGGKLSALLSTGQGSLVCIFLPAAISLMLIVTGSLSNISQYKAQQLSEIEAEKTKLEEDRQKNETMMEELLKLKVEVDSITSKQAWEPQPLDNNSKRTKIISKTGKKAANESSRQTHREAASKAQLPKETAEQTIKPAPALPPMNEKPELKALEEELAEEVLKKDVPADRPLIEIPDAAEKIAELNSRQLRQTAGDVRKAEGTEVPGSSTDSQKPNKTAPAAKTEIQIPQAKKAESSPRPATPEKTQDKAPSKTKAAVPSSSDASMPAGRNATDSKPLTTSVKTKTTAEADPKTSSSKAAEPVEVKTEQPQAQQKSSSEPGLINAKGSDSGTAAKGASAKHTGIRILPRPKASEKNSSTGSGNDIIILPEDKKA